MPGVDDSALEASTPAEIIVLGKIVGAHGIQGALRVYPYADDPSTWGALPYWWLGHEGDAPAAWQRTAVRRCTVRDELLIAQLACFTDRTAAEAGRGLLVGAPREALPSTADDEYYWGDLIGLEVVNVAQQSLGQVLGLLETPANAVLRIGDGEGGERLLPFVDSVVLKVDLPAQRIEVDWGLDW
ncbi:MAG TPA: ribosome maturation factor RimM [Accumulibacter sp.]|nr:ribosome maturation factor RimM [Accumulibacter sp.]HMW17621.1 ribosome maturation factor RimM [Accumulibacter sp.]HMY06221.1 ribosome maturation factor RimM [Accumulibacter sp.]HNC17285.1 ribosome maturation factor RimM [Accumulibacter sp.]HND79947.1 ribosome maturation factor RimM [Accumulibacter sp.]